MIKNSSWDEGHRNIKIIRTKDNYSDVISLIKIIFLLLSKSCLFLTLKTKNLTCWFHTKKFHECSNNDGCGQDLPNYLMKDQERRRKMLVNLNHSMVNQQHKPEKIHSWGWNLHSSFLMDSFTLLFALFHFLNILYIVCSSKVL